jgi:hypothetical protein
VSTTPIYKLCDRSQILTRSDKVGWWDRTGSGAPSRNYTKDRSPHFSTPFSADAKTQWKISDEGGGNGRWRSDGKELYYNGADSGIMAVSITTSPDFEFGTPKLLFRPGPEVGNAPNNITRDGDRIVIAVPPPQLRQLTVFDRSGRVVARVGPPGIYGRRTFHPTAKT